MVNLSRTLPRRGLTFKCVCVMANAMRCTLEVFDRVRCAEGSLHTINIQHKLFRKHAHFFFTLDYTLPCAMIQISTPSHTAYLRRRRWPIAMEMRAAWRCRRQQRPLDEMIRGAWSTERDRVRALPLQASAAAVAPPVDLVACLSLGPRSWLLLRVAAVIRSERELREGPRPLEHLPTGLRHRSPWTPPAATTRRVGRCSLLGRPPRWKSLEAVVATQGRSRQRRHCAARCSPLILQRPHQQHQQPGPR